MRSDPCQLAATPGVVWLGLPCRAVGGRQPTVNRRVDESDDGYRAGERGALWSRDVTGGRKAQPRKSEKRSRAAAQLARQAASASPTKEDPASTLTRAMAAEVATRLMP